MTNAEDTMTVRPVRNGWLGLPLLAGLLLFGCGGSIVEDDWGEPAGWSQIRGTVTKSDGDPAVGVEILVTRCEQPIGGKGGDAHTDATGMYVVWVALPPAGIYRLPTSGLKLPCDVIVARGAVEAPAEFTFARHKDDVEPVTIDLIIPH